MNFRININEWICGNPSYLGANKNNSLGKGFTELLNIKGYRCCLGQICRQLGLKDDELLLVDAPCSITKKIRYLKYRGDNSKLANEAISINDDLHTTVQEKMKLLRALFKKHGHKLIFYKGKNATCPI